MHIPHETMDFLNRLLRQCTGQGLLTFTAIHPDGNHRTPSHHIPITDNRTIKDALQNLLLTNDMGWGAYVGVGLRRRNLGRWRRGGNAEVLTLSALFTDVDDPSESAQHRIRNFNPPPSCIVFTGGGYHGYWWLESPLSDLGLATELLRGISQQLQGDPMSVSQMLRLPGSINTKPKRHGAACHIIDIHDRYYAIDDFRWLMNESLHANLPEHHMTNTELNPILIQAVTETLYREHRAFDRRNGWIGAMCPLPHKQDRPGKHFSFQPQRALGVCWGKHGRLLLKPLCEVLNINPHDYGGFYA